MLNKILQLTRSLAILDCETTGLDPKVDRIIQITVTMHYAEKDPIKWSTFVNPEISILNKQHGITNEMVEGFPPFREHAESLARALLKADIGGFHTQFDIDMITNEMIRSNVEFKWNNHIIDALQIYRLKRGHNLSNAFIEYGGENGHPLSADTDLTKAHDSDFDVYMTECVLRGQLLRYDKLPRTIPELSSFCFPRNENAVDAKGQIIWVGNDMAINFGKHRGKLLKDVDKFYMNWIIKNDFPEEIKIIMKSALDGIFIKKEDWK